MIIPNIRNNNFTHDIGKMSETQYHQGSRLKKFVDKSEYTLKEISEKSDVPTSSIYDMFKKSELLPSKFLPLLKVMGVTMLEFEGKRSKGEEVDIIQKMTLEIESLKRENELLKQQIASKDEIIQLLKLKRK